MIRKWGNSASVRLSAALMDAAHLHLDQEVDISVNNGRLIIEPIRQQEYTLGELLDDINTGNLHDPVDWGDPVGRERW